MTSTDNNLGAANGDNGPDFKVVAANVNIPEPGSVIGLFVISGLGWLQKAAYFWQYWQEGKVLVILMMRWIMVRALLIYLQETKHSVLELRYNPSTI